MAEISSGFSQDDNGYVPRRPFGRARHFHHASAFAIKLRRLRQERTDGDNTRTTDACDNNIMRALDLGNSGNGRSGKASSAVAALRGVHPRRSQKTGKTL